MQQIDKAVENICELGCKSVNRIRTSIERGEMVRELSGMSKAEQFQVKKELDEIMKVYENRKRLSHIS